MLTGSARVGVGREREKARDTEGRAGGDKSMPMCKRAHRHTYTRWLTFTFLLTQAESRPCNLYESLILPQELKCICLPPFCSLENVFNYHYSYFGILYLFFFFETSAVKGKLNLKNYQLYLPIVEV